MNWSFLLLASFTLVGAVGTMVFRNLVHCALCLVVTFAGLAGLFLQLEAQFVGLVQVLVYVGAVAILIVFAMLLTRQLEPHSPAPISTGAGVGIALAVAAFLLIGGAVRKSPTTARLPAVSSDQAVANVSVRAIGDRLMTDYVLPMEVVGLLLTAALIGAVIVAMPEAPAQAGGRAAGSPGSALDESGSPTSPARPAPGAPPVP